MLFHTDGLDFNDIANIKNEEHVDDGNKEDYSYFRSPTDLCKHLSIGSWQPELGRCRYISEYFYALLFFEMFSYDLLQRKVVFSDF